MLDGMTDALTQRNVTRSHLEHQVVASISLKSPIEYLYWCVHGAVSSQTSQALTAITASPSLLSCLCGDQDPSLRAVPRAGRGRRSPRRPLRRHDGAVPCVRLVNDLPSVFEQCHSVHSRCLCDSRRLVRMLLLRCSHSPSVDEANKAAGDTDSWIPTVLVRHAHVRLIAS